MHINIEYIMHLWMHKNIEETCQYLLNVKNSFRLFSSLTNCAIQTGNIL